MTNLVNTLQSIVRNNGNPDVARRKAELEELISVLFPSEIRLLKQSLTHMTFVRDFVPELPAEIRIGITTFLDLQDLITVRCISKRWYESWTQVSISNKLMKEYFRSAFENTYLQLRDQEKRSAFIAASNQLCAMRNGRYHSMTILRYCQDKDESSAPAPVLDRRYCGGRVGWSIEGGIKISNLCSGAKSIYMLPNRDKVQFWALSESTLVVGTADKAKLYAWQLEGGELTTVRLPSLPCHKLSVQGNRVGIVTSKNEVMVWIVGGPVIQMNIIDPTSNHNGFRELAVLFHPDSANIVFIIFVGCQKVDENFEVTGIIQWRVQKYVRGELVATFKWGYPLGGLDYRSRDELVEVPWLSPRKLDDNGVYSIGVVPVDYASRVLNLGCCHHWDTGYSHGGLGHLGHHITFDVYGERISSTFYHLPGGHKDVDYINFVTPQREDRPLKGNSHLWSGQIFLPVIKVLDPVILRDSRYKSPIKEALLIAIKSCDQISGPPTSVQYIGGHGMTKTARNTTGGFAARDLGSMNRWVGDPHLVQQNPSAVTNTEETEEHHLDHEVQGDGTFVVLFSEYSYVVWCYDKKLRVYEE